MKKLKKANLGEAVTLTQGTPVNVGTQGMSIPGFAYLPTQYSTIQDPTEQLKQQALLNQQAEASGTPVVQVDPNAGTTNNQLVGAGVQEVTTETKSEFGTPNWDWIMASQTARSGLKWASETFGNSRANATQEHNRQKFNPLNYLPKNPNTSLQDYYGMDYAKKGGLVKKEDGGSLEGEINEDNEWDFLFEDEQPTTSAVNEEFSRVMQENESLRGQVEEFQTQQRDMEFLNNILNGNNSDLEYSDDELPDFSQIDMSGVPAGSFTGIFSNEGAATGQPTNLNSSAIGRGQMIKGTRMSMYKKLGIKDTAAAEKQFKTDPQFEMQVLNAYRDELGSQIPENIQGSQREYMIAKGWYTGDVNYDDNKVPHPEAGNKLTAGEYAKRALRKMEQGGGIEYKKGSTYDVDYQELDRLRKLGYDIEIL